MSDRTTIPQRRYRRYVCPWCGATRIRYLYGPASRCEGGEDLADVPYSVEDWGVRLREAERKHRPLIERIIAKIKGDKSC